MTFVVDGSLGAGFPDGSYQPSSASPYVLKNRLLNGAFQIAQRGTSATITAGSTIAAGYATVDRWYAYSTGANVTMAQVAGSGNNKNLLQITGAASVTAVGIGQRIEQLNSYDMAGQTATLSVNIANSLLTSVTWTAYYANTADTFGTLASPTRTQIATGTFTVTSTLTQYSAQISIPSAATTGIEIVFTVGAQTSGTWQLGNAQLEIGTTATPFERRLYNQELANCQRYFISSYPDSVAINGNAGALSGANFTAVSTNDCAGANTFPVRMRATPTITIYAPGGGSGTGTVRNASSGAIVSSVTTTNDANQFAFNRISGSFTSGVVYSCQYLASAEL